MRQRDDLLAPVAGLAAGGSLATIAPGTLAAAAGCWADRLGAGVTGLGQRAGSRGGEQTGPNPTDRGKSGSKRHIVVDRNGIPLAVTQSAANVHASRMVEATVVAIPPLRLRGGRRHGRSEPWRADLRGAAGGADPRRRSACAGGWLQRLRHECVHHQPGASLLAALRDAPQVAAREWSALDPRVHRPLFVEPNTRRCTQA